MLRWGRVSIVYALIAALALALGMAFGRDSLFQHPQPWLPFSSIEALMFGLVLGVSFAGLVVVSTRVLVMRASWARTLHRDLRPITGALDGNGIVAIAALSGLAEELLFRGLLQPWIGLWAQATLFGLMHAQLPGPSRWVWAAWASIVGIALGAMFQLTGSLWGPIVAHALINGLNMLYLKDYDPAPPQRSLGGLLSDRASHAPPQAEGESDRRSPVPAGRRA
jgi:hypothetical protein